MTRMDKLNNKFWNNYELDLQEVKLSYLNWAISRAKKPDPKYRHLFLWNHQKDFCIVDSRYGRSFAISPFGIGVRGVPKSYFEGIPKGLDETDLELKNRLSKSTNIIRTSIRGYLDENDINKARNAILNFYWLKLGSHELMFDQIQYGENETGKAIKGRINVEKPEDHASLNGVRNRIINVLRFGENLERRYVKSLDKKLPGFSDYSYNTFLSAGLTWNRYGLCSFDCGPVLWSKKGFVDFETVKNRMKEIGWPYQSTARELLRPLFKIVMDYKKPPICLRDEPDEGYNLKSLRQRACEIYELIDRTLEEIHKRRESIE